MNIAQDKEVAYETPLHVSILFSVDILISIYEIFWQKLFIPQGKLMLLVTTAVRLGNAM